MSGTKASLFAAPVGCTVFPNIHLGLCSGEGQCVMEFENGTTGVVYRPNLPGSKCLCHPGWTGFNDFVNMDTHDCGQNLIAIRLIWVALLFGSLLEIYFSTKKLQESYKVWKEHLLYLAEKKLDSKTATADSEELDSVTPPTPSPRAPRAPPTTMEHWSLVFKWPLVVCASLSFVSGASFGIMSLIKVASPTQTIGSSIPVTILFIIWDATFIVAERWCMVSWLNIQNKLVRFTEKDERLASQAILRLRRVIYVGWFLDFCRQFLILALFGFPQQANILTCIIYTTIPMAIIISGVGITRVGRNLEAILLSGLDALPKEAKEERERSLTTIRKVVEDSRTPMIPPLIICIMTGWWPFLRSHLSYIIIHLLPTFFIMVTHLSGMRPPSLHRQKKEHDHNKQQQPRDDSNNRKERGESKHSPLLHGREPILQEADEEDVGSRRSGNSEENSGNNKIPLGVELQRVPSIDRPESPSHHGSDLDSSTQPLHSSSLSPPLHADSAAPSRVSSSSDSPAIFNPFR